MNSSVLYGRSTIANAPLYGSGVHAIVAKPNEYHVRGFGPTQSDLTPLRADDRSIAPTATVEISSSEFAMDAYEPLDIVGKGSFGTVQRVSKIIHFVV